MSDLPVCRNCGYFVQFEIPKEPEQPRWVHTPSRPDKPADNDGPCGRAEPEHEHQWAACATCAAGCWICLDCGAEHQHDGEADR